MLCVRRLMTTCDCKSRRKINMDVPMTEILITEEELQARIKELGEEITKDFSGKDVVVVGVLKGSFIFVADLVRHIDLPLTLDFVACSSYGSSTVSSGVVRIMKDLDRPIEGKHVIVVEDIVDTGTTLDYLIKNFKSRGVASLHLVTLLNKPERRKVDVPVDYTGFVIPDKFVGGFGLDYDEKYRNLPYICVLDPERL